MMVSVALRSVENIEEVKMSFSAKFKLDIEWFEKRLDWENLNEDAYINVPKKDVMHQLWIPSVIFQNTQENHGSSVDEKSMIFVKKLTNGKLSDISEIEEIAYYKGSQNSIFYSREFYHSFQCLFELHDYPFDTQKCKILLKKQNKEDSFVEFVAKNLKYIGPPEMAEFTILKLNMRKPSKEEEVDIEVEIILKRRIAQHLLSTYLPSACILCIAQVLSGQESSHSYFLYMNSAGDCVLCKRTFQDCNSIGNNLYACDVHLKRISVFQATPDFICEVYRYLASLWSPDSILYLDTVGSDRTSSAGKQQYGVCQIRREGEKEKHGVQPIKICQDHWQDNIALYADIFCPCIFSGSI